MFIISNKDGILKVLNLINGKLRTKNKFNQVLNNVLVHTRYAKEQFEFQINDSNSLDNHWIAGFSDADASFQIKIINKSNRLKPEIRLNFQIACSAQKDKDILILIQNFFGGNIGYRESQDTYYYGSTNFGSARNIIRYFDNFHLQSSKYMNYLKWRKAYILIQEKHHLCPSSGRAQEIGIDKIMNLKNSMNRNSV